jgi:hypothetical protein
MPTTLPRNGDLADQLDLLADLSEILEEESFKVIAYRRAAGRIRESPLPIAELALDGKAKELPGIGKTIENKVVEVVEDGEMHALTKRRGLVPAGVVEFLRLPGVGPKTAAWWGIRYASSVRGRASYAKRLTGLSSRRTVSSSGGQRGNHGIKHRQGQRGAHAAQERPPRQGLLGDEHIQIP